MATDITEPSAVNVLLLCVHLYHRLPYYLPSRNVEFPSTLFSNVTKQVRSYYFLFFVYFLFLYFLLRHFFNYARSERSERSGQLLAFKRENFVYSRTKNSHFSMCLFRGCGFTYGKKTSLLHVSVLSYFEIVEIIGLNTRELT